MAAEVRYGKRGLLGNTNTTKNETNHTKDSVSTSWIVFMDNYQKIHKL